MTTFDLLIVYKCLGDKKVIEQVTSYGYNEATGMFWFEKNGFKSFTPKENVKYFGRKFDYEGVPATQFMKG